MIFDVSWPDSPPNKDDDEDEDEEEVVGDVGEGEGSDGIVLFLGPRSSLALVLPLRDTDDDDIFDLLFTHIHTQTHAYTEVTVGKFL